MFYKKLKKYFQDWNFEYLRWSLIIITVFSIIFNLVFYLKDLDLAILCLRGMAKHEDIRNLCQACYSHINSDEAAQVACRK